MNEGGIFAIYRLMYLMPGNNQRWEMIPIEFTSIKQAKIHAQRIHYKYLDANDNPKARVMLLETTAFCKAEIHYDGGNSQ